MIAMLVIVLLLMVIWPSAMVARPRSAAPVLDRRLSAYQNEILTVKRRR